MVAQSATKNGCAQDYLRQHRRLTGREGQTHLPFGPGRLVPRPQRKHTEKAAFQEGVLLSGMHLADRGHRGHGRPAVIPAREDGSSAHLYLRKCRQSTAVSQPTHPLPQQEQLGSQYSGMVAEGATTTVAQRLDGLCAVRQLVRFRTVVVADCATIDQICPPSRLARYLRPQMQSQAQWETHRPTRLRSQAQAVHTNCCDRLRTGTPQPTTCARPLATWRTFPTTSASSSRNGIPDRKVWRTS